MQKGCDLVPLLCISSEAVQHNLGIGYNLTMAKPELSKVYLNSPLW